MAQPTLINRKKRLLTFFMVITFIFFLLVGRTGYLQIVQGGWLSDNAEDQWTRTLSIAAKRGSILDRNGTVLAQSASAEIVVLRPSQISKAKNAEKVADELARILEMDRDAILKKAQDTTKQEIWIKRGVLRETADEIRALELAGIAFTADSKRYYPMKNYLSQVLGFTNIDGDGQDGLEARYNQYLKGINGRSIVQTDNKGNPMPHSGEQIIPAVDGGNLVLTIDYAIQSFVEKTMKEALENNNAKKVSCIVMDPNTGEILAMVNKPDFDLNEPPRDDIASLQALSRNACVSDVYEPGSTLKVITSAIGLEEGVVNPESTFHDPGYRVILGRRIKCWKTSGHGSQTFREGLQNSCNPVFMDIATRVGKDKYYEYLNAFGFGQKTGIDLAAEETGIMRAVKYVTELDLACIGFGQSIAVTPMQLISAAAAVINGGTLMKPYIVSGVQDEEGNLIEAFEPVAVRQVISKTTSDTMRDLLESVVREGGGKNAYIPGYRVGGKTGTAQKSENGVFVQGKNVASFLGFAPADDPKVMLLLIVDEPNTNERFASTIAAPYAKAILDDTLRYLKIEPDRFAPGEQQEALETVRVPDVRGLPLAEATQVMKQHKLQWIADADSGTVLSQLPVPDAMMPQNSIILLYMEGGSSVEDGKVAVPDVVNLTVEQARELLTAEGLHLMVSGSGKAVSQSISAGERVDPGTVVTVEFRQEQP